MIYQNELLLAWEQTLVVYLMYSNLSFIDYPYVISALVNAIAATLAYNYKVK